MDYIPPDSPVCEILQVRILEWVTITFSRESSQSRNWSRVSCIAGGLFTIWDGTSGKYKKPAEDFSFNCVAL